MTVCVRWENKAYFCFCLAFMCMQPHQVYNCVSVRVAWLNAVVLLVNTLCFADDNGAVNYASWRALQFLTNLLRTHMQLVWLFIRGKLFACFSIHIVHEKLSASLFLIFVLVPVNLSLWASHTFWKRLAGSYSKDIIISALICLGYSLIGHAW